MKQANNTHYLADMISGEGSMGFTPRPDGRVDIFESAHPDLPAEESTHELEEAREIYRRAILAGWVKA